MATKQPKSVLTGHTAGIFADMTLDGPEIGTLVAVVDRAKNLPNRKTMGKQDPYCAMRLGKDAKKTDTDRRGGQTPKWDQELRFTVHESPDYYKLKCSIFNDDKKTDLIGEAWIDLSGIIKPGGGSNDLWHQLNYKGKYAGDIRIELTYYDLRPREEKPEKRRREKVSSPVEDIASPASLPRTLGPRDVRRRPLPSSPAASSPAQTPPVTTPPPVVAPREEPPPPPPKIPLPQSERVQPPLETRPQQEYNRVDHYIDEKPSTQLSVQHYRQPFCEEQSSYSDQQDEPVWNVYDQPADNMYGSQNSSTGPSPASISPLSWHNESEGWIQNDHRMSQQYITSDAEDYTSSRSLPHPPTHPMEPQYHSPQQNISPTKPSRYRDSPLRHSMNHYEPAMHMVDEPESYDEPPPPPVHRETTPRKQEFQYPPSAFPQNDQAVVSFSARPTAATSRRASLTDRSPLQHIEDEYELYARNQARLSRDFERRDSQGHDFSPVPRERQQSVDDHYHVRDRQHSYDVYPEQNFPRNEQYEHNMQQHSEPKPVYQKPVYQDRSESFDVYSVGNRSSMYEDAIVPHSQSQPNLAQPEYYKPQPIRPRPATSTPQQIPQQIPQRKAVSPGSSSRPEARRLSSIPFGPDAYDVLNPASSPVTNEGTIYQDREQGKEFARMREVQKLRDQGPIIGNDGRVIDPSDHLPSDTWAPEPERKTRKPEHVIHFRTKNDSRSRNTPTQSPTGARVDYHRQGDQNTHSSPSGPSSSNKHRQKPTPVRPLPTQPYPRVEARPEPQSRPRPVDEIPQKALQRYSHQEQSPVHRPHLSEYQVPPSSNYTPRGSSYQKEYARTPPKPHMQTGREYSPRSSDMYDNSLAAEMSMIDIGPRREGQMVLSSRRGY